MKIIFPEIDLENKKGVLFDLDNTLYLYKPCHQRALEACYKKFPKGNFVGSFEEFALLYKKHRDLVMKNLSPQGSCRSRLFAFQHLLEELKEPQAFIKAGELDALYWGSLISFMKLEESARNFLALCKEKSLKTCIVSDMIATIQIQKLKKLQVENSIDFLVTSEEVGHEKPNSLMFETALKKLDLSKGEVVMIGDDEKKDVEGAKLCGIDSYQIKII